VEGTPFGRYRLVELLGRGGMGEVWRAQDTAANNRTVAIKLLPSILSSDSTFVQRFRREADAAARLNNPHVIPIHNYGEIDGRLYVDMRLVEGRDLEEVLAGGPLEPGRAVRIVEQVAKALQAAHKIGLVHRDVKPSNILLDEDDFAYLIDFGIARGADETRLTSTGAMIGSWHYMAPERLRAHEADARADIYALACVLYECLTGHRPFPGDSLESQVAAHLSDPPPQPSTTQPNVSAQFDPVIAKGMAKDPDERYATTVELADAAHDAITTPISGPAQDLRTRPAFMANPAPATPATEPATRTPARQSWWSGQRRQVRLSLIAAIVVIVAAAATVGYLFTGRNPQRSNTAQPSTTPTGTTTATTPTGPPPVAEAALDGLLLTPVEINTAMGATGMTVTRPWNTLNDVATNPATPPECLPPSGAAEDLAYAGSGWTAMRGQTLKQAQPEYIVDQGVVLFPSAQTAAAFASTSSQSWSACANRSYTDSSHNNVGWSVGLVSTADGTLSTTATEQGNSKGWACQRALMARNNVVIDVAACSHHTTDQGVAIAGQIAAKVPT